MAEKKSWFCFVWHHHETKLFIYCDICNLFSLSTVLDVGKHFYASMNFGKKLQTILCGKGFLFICS